MKTLIENYKKEEFEIEIYFSQDFQGRGGWNINCEVDFLGNKKTFKTYTTDTFFIDRITNMKAENCSWDEIQQAYKESFFDDATQEAILEWIDDVLKTE